jgi:hypothetical protein
MITPMLQATKNSGGNLLNDHLTMVCIYLDEFWNFYCVVVDEYAPQKQVDVLL